MHEVSANINSLTRQGYFGRATVLDFSGKKFRVKIDADEKSPAKQQTWAIPAISDPGKLQWGDTVLVAGNSMASLYIIGIIDSRGDEKKLALADGTHATLDHSDGKESLKVFSNQGNLIFQYDPEKKKSSVGIQDGDLEFIAGNGCIDFVASAGIRFVSDKPVEIRSREKIKLVSKKIETVVETLIETAKNVYQTVADLTQLKTGRMRTLVDGTSHLKTKKAFYKAEEDFKIKGEKIHLG